MSSIVILEFKILKSSLTLTEEKRGKERLNTFLRDSVIERIRATSLCFYWVWASSQPESIHSYHEHCTVLFPLCAVNTDLKITNNDYTLKFNTEFRQLFSKVIKK